MNIKNKLQAKISEATPKREEDRQADNRRAAWNSVGAKFSKSLTAKGMTILGP